jgi:hypothetical protein
MIASGACGEHPVHRCAVADIGVLEGVTGAVRHACHVVETGRIGQRVDIHHLVAPCDRQPHNRRADEPRAARHQKLHDAVSS